MGKLVLRMPDGARREYPLERERLTIGRRADNDICLPFPAVSGEHAAVVTILDDSFLEDLGSTNGTLVNGKAITKHFLRDYDEIDIGRQTLIYVTHDYLLETQSALPPFNETVAVTANGGATIGDDEATVVTSARSLLRPADAPPPAKAEVVPPGAATTEMSPLEALLSPPDEASEARAEAPSGTPTLEVLDGASAGVTADMAGDEFILGRVGAQVAAVRRTSDGYYLVPLEGDAPRVNGAEIPARGGPLSSGDEIEIAETRIAFRAPA